jgi:hypothetical protein
MLLDIRFVFNILSGSTDSKLGTSDRKQQKHLLNRDVCSQCNEGNGCIHTVKVTSLYISITQASASNIPTRQNTQ